MGIKQLIVLFSTGLCFWLAYIGIHKVCTSCDGCQAKTEMAIEEGNPTTVTNIATTNNQKEKLEPIIFSWNKAEALTSSSFVPYRDSLMNKLKEDQQIEIFGYYFKEETTPEGYVNMGLARANTLIEKLSETIPKEKMQARAQLISEVDGIRVNHFISTSVRFIDAPQNSSPNGKPAKDVARVDQIGGLALIYFPFNSIQKINNQEIDNYLDKLASRVITSGEKIYLIGHTDDVGPEKSNKGIGRGRARAIRDILKSKGVPNTQVIIDSKGELEPTASNDTDANRALNRRVEVKVQ